LENTVFLAVASAPRLGMAMAFAYQISVVEEAEIRN